MTILTIIVVIFILGILIFAHELGHFVAAKKSGVKVEEFGFGFPPKIISFKRKETVYSLNLIPIGGFVKIYGEEREEKESKSKFAFYNRPTWQRAIILLAGVFMNLVVAAIFFAIVHSIGVPTIIEAGQEKNARNIQIQIVDIAKNSPAELSGIKIGDSVQELSYKNELVTVREIEDVQKFTAMHIGEEVQIRIKRGEEFISLNIIPRPNPPAGEGAMGIAMAKTGLISYPWYRSIWLGIKTTWEMIVTMLGLFYLLVKTLIIKGQMIGDVAGPVGIYTMTTQMVKLGWVYVLQFTAILSINLAIINALPFPALDGGRLLFLLIEKIRGKPLKFKTEKMANAIGFSILIILMIIVTFRDIIKLL